MKKQSAKAVKPELIEHRGYQINPKTFEVKSLGVCFDSVEEAKEHIDWLENAAPAKPKAPSDHLLKLIRGARS